MERFKIVILLLCYLSFNNATSQDFANKEFYLIDSLNLSQFSESQKEILDSCLKEFHEVTDDTVKIGILLKNLEQFPTPQVMLGYTQFIEGFINKLKRAKKDEGLYKYEALNYKAIGAVNYYLGEREKAILFVEKSINVFELLKDTINIISCKNDIAFFYRVLGEEIKALNVYKANLTLCNQAKDFKGKARVLSNLGSVYRKQGNITECLQSLNESLEISMKISDLHSQRLSLINLASVYRDLDEFDKTLDFMIRSLKVSNEIGDKSYIAKASYNIGVCYSDINNSEKAFFFNRKAELAYLDLESGKDLAEVYSQMGTLYSKEEIQDSAIFYFNKSLSIGKGKSNMYTYIRTIVELGDSYYNLKDLKKSKKFTLTGLELARKHGYIELIRDSYLTLYSVLQKQRKYKEALEYYHSYVKLKDSVSNDENLRKVFNSKYKSEYNIKSIADSIQYVQEQRIKDANNAKEVAIEKSKREQQTLLFNSVTIILALVCISLAIIYRRLKITRAQQKLIIKQKERVEQQKKHILKQQKITKSQKDLIEEQHKEIKDSINYAKNLQNSVLPSFDIKKINPKSFVLYLPKDQVSGDFFWLEKKNDLQFFIVADCTGHGVPGAFISMIGTILLNEIHNSKNIAEPSAILNELRRLVTLTLTNDKGETLKDGMDIVVGILNQKTNVLTFSGANNPLWIVSKDSKKTINKSLTEPNIELNETYLYEVKGDKMPIGVYDKIAPYKQHSILLNEGDNFFLFTDGFPDQFGGSRNKKFMYKAFKKLLISIYDESFENKKSILLEKHLEWKGSLDQVDDICIIGVGI